MPNYLTMPNNAKECSNYHTIALISNASKLMLKILQAGLQQYMSHELPDVQAVFRKGRGMGWGRRWEEGSEWGTHVNPWLIHVNVWQNPLEYCKVISIQLIKINKNKNYIKKKKRQRNQKSNCQHPLWIIKKAREFQKNIYFCFIDYAKAFDCVDHNKLWKILKEIGMQDHLTCLFFLFI